MSSGSLAEQVDLAYRPRSGLREAEALAGSARGEGGFGSTGT